MLHTACTIQSSRGHANHLCPTGGLLPSEQVDAWPVRLQDRSRYRAFRLGISSTAPATCNCGSRSAFQSERNPRAFHARRNHKKYLQNGFFSGLLGVFEAPGEGEKTAEEIAAVCHTNPEATKQLLNCLVGIGYARWSRGKYGMRQVHRKWLLRASPNSVVDKLTFQSVEWDLMGAIEDEGG